MIASMFDKEIIKLQQLQSSHKVATIPIPDVATSPSDGPKPTKLQQVDYYTNRKAPPVKVGPVFKL